MIKIESVHIEELRGVRKLDLKPLRQTFAIHGPNGSGKSGVVDAIEFGLTGQISRLTGRGTRGLTLSEHGPHVDMTKFPDAAQVTLEVHFPALGTSGTITRKVKQPTKPQITPNTPEMRAAFLEVEQHPELVLSRREILRFILAEPSKRAEEVQGLLKLDDLGQIRRVLNSAANKVATTFKAAESNFRAAREALQRHAQISTMKAEDLLESVNVRRRILALADITALTSGTRLDTGIEAASTPAHSNRKTVLADLEAAKTVLGDLPKDTKVVVEAILSGIARLSGDASLGAAVQRLSLIEAGLGQVSDEHCPLCDKEWPSREALLAHLREKIARSREADRLQRSIRQSSDALATQAQRVERILSAVQQGCATQEILSLPETARWKDTLASVRSEIGSIEGLVRLGDGLATAWSPPDGVVSEIHAALAAIAAKPDQTALVEAQPFLTTAQLRLSDYREAMRKQQIAKHAEKAAKATYETYCSVLESELTSLYEEVQKDFCEFYRAVNGDDEASFDARLTPSEGSLALDVNFYGRGLFPPAAYHSEGHQDGMGVCLYLALMRRLLRDRFTFALFDDVVMSVDSGHRYQFCKLLKKHFPDTQFVITTHDRVWAEQMKSSGLVNSKTAIAFHGWSVETGPLIESSEDTWAEIEAALKKGKVGPAAAALRRHLEYASRHLAGELAAPVVFKPDGGYELGDLLPSVLKRLRMTLGEAADAAQSWKDEEARKRASARKEQLSSCAAAMYVDSWAVNRAVHYNEWENFTAQDFTPVVESYRELLECFTCSTCNGWLHVSPRSRPEVLRCSCGKLSFNLTKKGS